MYAIHKRKCIVQHIINVVCVCSRPHFADGQKRKEFIAINTWYQYILSAHKEKLLKTKQSAMQRAREKNVLWSAGTETQEYILPVLSSSWFFFYRFKKKKIESHETETWRKSKDILLWRRNVFVALSLKACFIFKIMFFRCVLLFFSFETGLLNDAHRGS